MYLKRTMSNNYYIASAMVLTLIFLFFGSAVSRAGGTAGNEEFDNGPVSEINVNAEYMGTVFCLECHPDYKADFLKTKHVLSLGDPKAKPARQGCEQCHGPGSLHVDMIANDPGERGVLSFTGKTFLRDVKATCLKCHKSRIDATEWEQGSHNSADVKCMDCHDSHDRVYDFQLREETSRELCFKCHTTVKVEFETNRSHHPVNDESGCVICHDPHGEPDSMLKSRALDNKCTACHADTTGPFIYQHLSNTSDFGDGCASCHYAHSSSNLNLLKANGRALCLSCHTDMVNHMCSANCWTSGCHSQIHGSNDNILFIR